MFLRSICIVVSVANDYIDWWCMIWLVNFDLNYPASSNLVVSIAEHRVEPWLVFARSLQQHSSLKVGGA